MNIEQIVEFARGGGMKAAPKKAAAKPGAGAAVANVVGALAGGGCGNGTHNGKRGFQPGNKCAGGKRDSSVAKASRAHQSARRAVSRHVSANTLHTPEGRASVRAAASAHRELQAARDAQKADRAGARKASSAVASGRASALPAKGTTAASKAPHEGNPGQAPIRAKHDPVGQAEYLADQAKRHAAFLAASKKGNPGLQRFDIFDKPAPHPDVKARVEKSLDEASKAKAERATQHLNDLQTGAAAGAFKPSDIHQHVERIGRGATKDELFHAAKEAGIAHTATTKKALVEQLKQHAHSLSKPVPTLKPEGPGPKPAPAKEAAKHAEKPKPEAKPKAKPAEKPKPAEKAPAEPAKPAPKPAAEPPKATGGGIPHDKLREAMRKLHDGKIDDRQTNPAQVAHLSGVPKHEVEATLRELGAKGAISFDHASPEKVAMAKGYHTFPVDHEGKPYVGFRVDRPAKFEAATAGHAAPTATPKAEPPKASPKPTTPDKTAPAPSGSRLEHLVASAGPDEFARRKAARQFVEEAASPHALDHQPLGTAGHEKMQTLVHEGVAYHFPAHEAGRQKAAAALALLASGERIPRHISRHTDSVYLSDQEHAKSAEVVRRVAEGQPSLAKGRVAGAARDGNVAIYGDKYGPQQHLHLAHEMSHNFAKAIYGSTDPAPGSDFRRAMTSGERPVSAYGATSPREDFATSFQAYYADKDAFRRSHPARFAVVDRLAKDPHYGG